MAIDDKYVPQGSIFDKRIYEDLKDAYPKAPAVPTTEEILEQRRKYQGLPGFERTDYGKQALDDRRLTLALMGLSAAERGFGGMGTPPIPGEMAISTFGRGVLGPLAGDIKPIAADYYGRKTQRAAAQKAEAAGLTQAAITTLEQRNAAAAAQDAKIMESAIELSKERFGVFNTFHSQLLDHNNQSALAEELRRHQKEIEEIRGNYAEQRQRLIGSNQMNQIRETAKLTAERLDTQIAATSSLEDKKQVFQDQQAENQRIWQTAENDMKRAQEEVIAAEKEAGLNRRHLEKLKQDLAVFEGTIESREDLQARLLQAQAGQNNLDRKHTEKLARLDQHWAVLNQTEAEEAAFFLAAAKADWGLNQAVMVEEIRQRWQDKRADKYDKGVTQNGLITEYGARQMGRDYEKVKDKEFEITYHTPKPGWDSDIIQPYVTIMGGGKSFNSLDLNLDTGKGESVVADPTLMWKSDRDATAPKLYKNTSNETITLPLGGGKRVVKPNAGTMIDDWEWKGLPEIYKDRLREADATSLDRYQYRAGTVTTAWDRVANDQKIPQELWAESKAIAPAPGEIPYFQQFMTYIQGISGTRSKLSTEDLNEQANRFWADVKKTDDWKALVGREPVPEMATLAQSADPTVVVEEPGEEPWKDTWEKYRKLKFTPDIDYANLQEIQKMALKRIPRGVVEAQDVRNFNKNFREEVAALQVLRDKVDKSYLSTDEQNRFASLARVYGYLTILDENHELLAQTGRYFGSAWTAFKAKMADVPVLGDTETDHLLDILRQIDSQVESLKTDSDDGKHRSKFTVERVLNVAPKLGNTEAENRKIVDSALQAVRQQLMAYGSPDLQRSFELPKSFESTAAEIGLENIKVDDSHYPWRLPRDAKQVEPLFRFQDLDPEGISTRTETIEETIQDVAIGQKYKLAIDDGRGKGERFGWIYAGASQDGDKLFYHPDDQHDPNKPDPKTFIILE